MSTIAIRLFLMFTPLIVQSQGDTGYIQALRCTAGEFATIRIAAERNNCRGDNFLLLLSIYKSESGRPGREFGVLHPRAIDTNLDIQAGWCAATIVKTRDRWRRAGMPGNYIDFLGKRYCPVGAANDPQGLNINWTRNVKFWFNKLKGI